MNPTLDFALQMRRTGAWALDVSSTFTSIEDATKYAAGNKADPDSRGLCGTSYIGQVISVITDDGVKVYKIQADRSLSEVGTATSGDDQSIELVDGTLRLKGFDAAKAGQQLRVVNKGTVENPELELEFYTPDSSTQQGLKESVDRLEGDATMEGSVDNKIEHFRLNTLVPNYYTKKDIDGKLTGALHYQGTYETFEALVAACTPADESAEATLTPAVGDVYNIAKAGGEDASGVVIKAGDNVIYNGTGWDVSSGTVDLSAYYDKKTADETFVAKEAGKRLMTDDEGTKLGSLTKVEASETNGNVKIDGEEVTVYTAPTATNTAKGDVQGSTAQDKVAVEADGTMSINDVSGSKVKGTVAEASKTTHTFTFGTKKFDGSEDVSVGADDVPLPEDVVKSGMYGTDLKGGTVKSSTAQDKVSIGTDGTMTVNELTASKVKGAVDSAKKVQYALSFGVGESAKMYDGSTALVVDSALIGALLPSTVVHKTNYATVAAGGVVVSSATTERNGIYVDPATGKMTVNEIDAEKVIGDIGSAANAKKLGGVAAADILSQADGENIAKVKAAVAADKLANSRNVELTGDVEGSAKFDGSADLTIAATLPNIVTAGAYFKVTVNAKGQVLSGLTALVVSDIPDLTLSKITDAGKLAAKDKVTRNDIDTAFEAQIKAIEDATHEHTNKVVLDGLTSAKVSAWDDAAAKIDKKVDSSTTLSGYGITDAYTKNEIDGMIGGVFHYAGAYRNLDALKADITAGTLIPKPGDVYNLTLGGGTDDEGVEIKPGDNVVCKAAATDTEEAKWDVLSGTVDLSAYAKTADILDMLNAKATKTQVNELSDKIDSLVNTVGDASAGLVKKVADLETAKATTAEALSKLQSTVGADDTEGLQKKVADAAAAIAKLNGDASTAGSVDKKIADAAKTTNDSIDAITKDGGTIDTKVKAHADATDAHATLFAAKQNKAFQSVIAMSTANFAAKTDSTDPGKYVGTFDVSAKTGTTKNYRVEVDPMPQTRAQYKACVAAGFYPQVSFNAGTLKVFCENMPTADIAFNLTLTFTEINA
ncbi:MAG: hypothetical protein NC548_05860 [Lachnospiraceae bacterium]|nr:hypothetical protein [Lachnospiraceae bacterium]